MLLQKRAVTFISLTVISAVSLGYLAEVAKADFHKISVDKNLIAQQGVPLTITHSRNGSSHTEKYMKYKTWGGANWTAWIYGNGVFHHQQEGSSNRHADFIINYVTWDGSQWTAKFDPKRRIFKHTRRGTDLTHEDTILNYITWDGSKWTMRIQ